MKTNISARFFFVLCFASITAAAVLPATAQQSLRPGIVVADAASQCPSVAGAFVVLLDPGRGLLLLSGAPFPGGHVIGDARGGKLTVSLPDGTVWNLDRAGSDEGQTPMWGARYPFLATSGSGCVGFDREHWSSEGDLVTYARWLVEEIYFQLPIGERQRRPDFRIADRQVSFRVDREGYGSFDMAGKEGSTLAGRYEDSQRTYLFMPFVLDEGSERVAVRISATDGKYFDTTAKSILGWAVGSPGEPGALPNSSFVVVIKSVMSSPEN